MKPDYFAIVEPCKKRPATRVKGMYLPLRNTAWEGYVLLLFLTLSDPPDTAKSGSLLFLSGSYSNTVSQRTY